MNKHEEARNRIDESVSGFSNAHYSSIHKYITSCEATEKAYEELKRDVKQFMDSVEFTLGDIAIHTDLGKLIERLKKVGKE